MVFKSKLFKFAAALNARRRRRHCIFIHSLLTFTGRTFEGGGFLPDLWCDPSVHIHQLSTFLFINESRMVNNVK